MPPSLKAKLIGEVVKERDKYLTNDAPDDKKGDGFVKAMAATNGFVSEAKNGWNGKKIKRDTAKIKKAATATAVVSPPSHPTEKRASEPAPAPTDIAAAFLHRHPQSIFAPFDPSTALASPILIPQCRPYSRARGFSPAYAPILSKFDISQDVFLDFIVTLNESLRPSPYLNAINLASFAGEASPEPLIGLLIGEAVERVTTVIMEVQSRMKSNEFLDDINEGFFAPRGLFAFIGTWRPNRDATERAIRSRVDEGAIPSHPHVSILDELTVTGGGKRVATRGGWRDFQARVQRAMLPAGGEFAAIVPETLAWPSAEEIAAASPGRRTENNSRFNRAGVWVDVYVDKQSQVIWTQGNHGHPFAGSLPKPEFRSRYADPNHAASSGDLVALLTGGRWHIKKVEKKAKKQARK